MIKRIRYRFTGIVQGVGFRPFIYRMAVQHSLSGFVQNRSDGIIIEVEGAADIVEKFSSFVKSCLPPLAEITDESREEIECRGERKFRIIRSEKGGASGVHISPDIALCDECLQELFSPQDRRYRYPFINCTNCGPRLTIIQSIPYDRANTSMSAFPLCPQCRKEYEDPLNRRFHAEPNACPVCGPSLSLLDKKGKHIISSSEPVFKTIELLLDGFIVAVKGLGGYHLCVDASNDNAVKRLRARKFREEKPLAIMVRNIGVSSEIAQINDAEEKLLFSPQKPIVILKKKNTDIITPAIAPGMPNIGIMLPYTPVHYLLLEKHLTALVMTSANWSDEPICIRNDEALSRLHGIADFFLTHNRDILVRCDDSIAMMTWNKKRILRRSRGFAPKPIQLKNAYPDILALGPQLKTSICIVKGNHAFLSPHIGDMETPQARDFLDESISLMKHITEDKPKLVACDLHPGYYTSNVASKITSTNVIRVQHHHAHIVSCMAENNISGTIIGIAMDGTGYGTDGHIWGGEFLVSDEASFTRAGHIKYFQLPGGERAIREPWRIAVSLLKGIYGTAWKETAAQLFPLPDKRRYDLLDAIMEKKINCPYTSSLGRIFDGVASLLGIRQKVSFEGQAAMELEATANGLTEDISLPYSICHETDSFILDLLPAIKEIVEELTSGSTTREELAASFHKTICKSLTEMTGLISQQNGLNRVGLSGGCFQNRLLLEGTINELEKAGFEVFSHHLIPTNDGGISLGQAVSAGARWKKELID